MRVAAASWKLRRIRGDSEFFGHLYDLVEAAHGQDVDLLVLPELFVLELLHLEPDLAERKVPRYLVQYQQALEEWLVRISSSSGIMLVAGSHFREHQGGIVNTCAIAEPGLPLTFGPKNNLTTYEREVWGLYPGSGLARPARPRIGVTVCYDSEFPEAGRVLAEAGVTVHCVPAYTETRYGFQRVRWSCLARAIENQYFVAHSSLVGSLGREPVAQTYGSSAILAPSIAPFPESAVLAETALGEEGIAVADLDFSAMEDARQHGDVRNFSDRHAGRWHFLEGPPPVS